MRGGGVGIMSVCERKMDRGVNRVGKMINVHIHVVVCMSLEREQERGEEEYRHVMNVNPNTEMKGMNLVLKGRKGESKRPSFFLHLSSYVMSLIFLSLPLSLYFSL